MDLITYPCPELSWFQLCINSLRPSDAYMCVSKLTIIGSDNEQAGTKPLSESMLEYGYLDPWEQYSVKS